jgi:pilus assembly protein CpaC
MVGCCLVVAGWAVTSGKVVADPPYLVPPEVDVQFVQDVPQFAIGAGPKLPDVKGPDAKVPAELPAPRPMDPWGPGKIRLPFMGGRNGQACTPGGGAPVPTAKEQAEFNRFIKDFVDPNNTLDLILGRTRLMVLKSAPRRVQMGDDKIAAYNILSPTELTLLGKALGTTVLNIWFTDPANKDKEVVLSYLVRVMPDPAAKDALERAYKALQDEINHAFPDSRVCLFLIGDKLAVSGQARDIAEAAHIIQLVEANAPTPPAGAPPAQGGGAGPGAGALGPLSMLAGIYGQQGRQQPASRIVNLLHVPGEQQVMLKVTVAEVDRAAARSIGVNFDIMNSQGVTVFANNTGNLFNNGVGGSGSAGTGLAGTNIGTTGTTGTGANNLAGASSLGSVVNNLPAALDGGLVALAISALRNMNYARSLAEPNLVALNGQTASFQAGGAFPVPVVTGFTASGLQGVSFIPFGVQLNFTPFITDKDRIRLSVAAEVSTPNPGASTTVGTSNVPGLNTRNFQTTVELREGQTLAVAGLIQNNLGVNSTRVPFFGDLPVVGRLLAFDNISSGEQELVVLVTPQLVHPLEHKEVPPLPGSDLFEPGDVEFYLLGRLESRRNYDYRSQVRTDLHRQLSYHRNCEDTYIYGPHGQTQPPPAP